MVSWSVHEKCLPVQGLGNKVGVEGWHSLDDSPLAKVSQPLTLTCCSGYLPYSHPSEESMATLYALMRVLLEWTNFTF